MKRLVIAFLVALAGCGGGSVGDYIPQGDYVIDDDTPACVAEDTRPHCNAGGSFSG